MTLPDQSMLTHCPCCGEDFGQPYVAVKTLTGEQYLGDAQCTCAVSEPDEFGNRDLIEDDNCPIHGA